MNRNTKMQKHILSDQIILEDELILNNFIKNESKFNDLRYIISYHDYLKKENNRRNGDFFVYDGRQVLLHHLIKGQRYFGNTKMVKCSPNEITRNKPFNRMIKVNGAHLFLNAMLFVLIGKEIYRLRDNEGHLQLHISKRQTIKTIKSLEILNQ